MFGIYCEFNQKEDYHIRLFIIVILFALRFKTILCNNSF